MITVNKNKTSELAILGGAPVRSKPLPIYNTIGNEEKKAVLEVLDSGELSGFIAYNGKEFWGGRAVLALEKAFVTVTPALLVPSNFRDTGANRVTWSMT